MKHNKTLKICLVMVLAVALVGMAMARTSVLKATDTGDADYNVSAPAAESVVQNISIPAPVETPAATEATEPATTAATEATEPATTAATEATEPAATEATEATEPSATEAAEVTGLAETEATEATEPAETEASETTEATEPAASEAAESTCTCGAADGQPHAEECPLYVEPEATEPACTCGAAEGQPHAVECPLYEEPTCTCGAAEGQSHAEECPLYEEPTCTCGAAEGQPHAEECPLYEEPIELDVDITLTNLSGGEIAFGSNLRLTAKVSNAPEGAVLTYQWFYSLDSVNWQVIDGATAADYDFTLNEENNQYYWRVVAKC